MLPDRLYHFEFDGIEKKITIQAKDSVRARTLLMNQVDKLPQYKGRNVIQETTEALITGVTTRVVDGKKYVWDGITWKQHA